MSGEVAAMKNSTAPNTLATPIEREYKSLFAVEFTKSTIVTAELPDFVQNSN